MKEVEELRKILKNYKMLSKLYKGLLKSAKISKFDEEERDMALKSSELLEKTLKTTSVLVDNDFRYVDRSGELENVRQEIVHEIKKVKRLHKELNTELLFRHNRSRISRIYHMFTTVRFWLMFLAINGTLQATYHLGIAPLLR